METTSNTGKSTLLDKDWGAAYILLREYGRIYEENTEGPWPPALLSPIAVAEHYHFKAFVSLVSWLKERNVNVLSHDGLAVGFVRYAYWWMSRFVAIPSPQQLSNENALRDYFAYTQSGSVEAPEPRRSLEDLQKLYRDTLAPEFRNDDVLRDLGVL